MGTRGVLRIYLGAAPGVGKTYAMLDEGHRRLERGTDVVVGFVETHGRLHTAERIGDLPILPRRQVSYRGATFEEMDLDAVLAATSRGRIGGRDGAHHRPGIRSEHEALAGHPGPPRRRHRRDLHGQRPASGIAGRRGRADHRGDAEGDRPGRRGARRRPDRAGRHEPGGAAPADGPRQHLSAGADRRGPEQLLPSGQPHRAAGTRAALAGRPGRGGHAALPGAARHHRNLGDPRADRGRADRRPRGRDPDPPGGPHRHQEQRRRTVGGSRHPRRRAGGRRHHRAGTRSAGWSSRWAAAITRWSATASRRHCWSSREASTPPRSCWGPAVGGGTRRCSGRAPARSSPACPDRSTRTSSATTSPAAAADCQRSDTD